MRNIISKLVIAFAAITCIASTQSLAAQNACCPDACCNPCWDPCDWCGDFEVGAHALYFKPMHCAYAYAQTTNPAAPPNTVKIFDIKADYDWGFRVFVGYISDCTFVDVSYLWLETGDSQELDTAGLPGIAPIGVTAGTTIPRVRAFLGFDYQNVDIRIGQFLHRRCGCDFNVFANIRWVDIERRNQVIATSFPGGVPGATSWRQKAEFDGAGLGVGSAGEFCVWRDVNFFGSFNFMGIIGDRKTPRSVVVTDAGAVSTISWRSNTCVIPAFDFRLGLNYTWNCACTVVTLELGYEGNFYWNALEYQTGVQNAAATTNPTRECHDIGFAGPFFGGRVMF